MAKDFYQILGVNKSSSQDEIKRAYRKKAHEFHPDKGNGNAEKFKEVNEAYQVLSDPAKRQQYDQFGTTFDNAARNGGGGFSAQGGPASGWGGFGFDGFGGFGQGGVEFDLGDIFSDIFGGRQAGQSRRSRGVDLEMPLTISFEESIHGTTKTITLEKTDKCETCKGTGTAPGAKTITCPKCHGQGQILTQRRTIFGNMQSAATCDRCDGEGKVPETPCRVCGGRGILKKPKTLEIKIPAGIDSGQRIRITGEGEVGYKGSSPGDLYVIIRVNPSKEFIRDGTDLRKDIPVSFMQATLGAKILVNTLDGKLEVRLPAGSQPGTILKVTGKGVPQINSSKRGDLLLTVNVVVPTKLSKKEKELLQELAKIRGESVEINQSFWDSMKENF